MENQAYIFFIFILNGFIIGILFDMFRILRRSFKTRDIITYIQDFIFWILSGIIVLYSLFKFNNGNIRGYIFLGIIIGYIFYYLLFSKLFINVNVFIIRLIKKIFNYVIIKPFRKICLLLKKIFLKPVVFLFINVKKIMSKFVFKYKKINKKPKNEKDLI